MKTGEHSDFIIGWLAGVVIFVAWLAGALVFTGVARAQGAPQGAQPVSLQEAIEVALRDNSTLRTARLGLESAAQQVREARGSLFPEVDATLSYQRNLRVPEAFLPAIIFDPNAPPDELIPVRFGADNQWVARLSVTQPIFDAAALTGVGAAGRVRALQGEAVRGYAQGVASTVRRRYYDALLAREQVRVTGESVRRFETTLSESQALHRAGLTGDYDVLRIEVRLANLRPDLRRAENDVAAAERTLAVAMGLDGGVEVPVIGRLHEVTFASIEANEGPNVQLLELVGYPNALDASFEELLASARRMRSDLRQARLQAELEGARVAYERSQFFPKLSAFFDYAITAQENGRLDFFGETSSHRTRSAFAGLQIEIPIFSGFARSARLEQSQLARRQVEVELARLEREIENQIETALERLHEARLRAEAQRAAVGQARRGFEIVSAEYLAGTSSQLEVIDAEVALRESEFNYAHAVYDYLVAQADLDDAVGVVPLVDRALDRPVPVAGLPQVNAQ